MALNDLGKVALTFGGVYSPTVLYERLTVVVGEDGQTYATTQDNVIGISPGVTETWEGVWQIVSMRGPTGNGIVRIAKTGTSGTVDTYTVYYDDGNTWQYTVSNGEGIQSIELTGSENLVDTYTITFGNGQTATFTVTNARELAAGGTTGQVLTKKSNADYDVEWKTPASAIDNLTSTSTTDALSANQGRVLKSLVDGKASKTTTTVNITSPNWAGSGPYTQTVNAAGVTDSNAVVVSPIAASFEEYSACAVRATAQAAGRLTFTATLKPTLSMTVNVLCIN